MTDVRILCPPRYETGGVELLHQFTAELSTIPDMDAQIFYWDTKSEKGSPHPKIYADRYKNKYTLVNEKTIFDNLTIVFPEIFINSTFSTCFDKTRKVIYWESVDNYFRYGTKDILFNLPDSTIHLAQSAYAENFLKNQMGFKNVIRVGDYLNDDFLLINTELMQKRKIANTVCYNPAKGLDFTKKIIKATPGVIFTELKGLNRAELIDTLTPSMLYIDFGSHPGKDRLPREAAMCGCCILVGAIGSAVYEEDMPIPRPYKVDFKVEKISEKIYKILNNYNACIRDFYNYRNAITREKKKFQKEVRKFAEVIK